jgi:hypothetical protein
MVLKYGVSHRNHTRSGRPEHRRRRVRIGQVQLALYKIGWQHGRTVVLIIQGTQNPDRWYMLDEVLLKVLVL